MQCLVVVAHPDDESIWMGGVMLRHRDWHWHVLSLCRAGDPDREPRFHTVARELGVRGRISDLDDSPVLAPLSPDLREIKDRVRDLLPREADLIFTHGPDGEYTYHPRHVEISRAVREMVRDGELTGTLVFFAYEDGGGAYRPRPAADAQIRIELTPEELTRKQHVLRDIYDFQPGSLEFDSAGLVEAFNLENLSTVPDVQRLLDGQVLIGPEDKL